MEDFTFIGCGGDNGGLYLFGCGGDNGGLYLYWLWR